MIREYALSELCKKYNILIKKSENILIRGNYKKMDSTLNYLINELKISVDNIEKCPSILYKNAREIKLNIEFLKAKDISFSKLESCLHVLCVDHCKLKETYEYVAFNYGINAIEKITTILSCPLEIIKEVELLNIPIPKIEYLTIANSIKSRTTSIEEVQKIISSDEFKTYPRFFTTETLAHGNYDNIKEILSSEEFKKYPELFTSQTLAFASLEGIKRILSSEEFRKYPELFTSQTLAFAKLEDIKRILSSDEFRKYPELFTSETLTHTKFEEVQKIIASEEFKEHPELFTPTTLAYAKLEDIQKLIRSDEFKKHPKLFTSQTLAHAKLEEVQKIMASEEFKENQSLFTSETLAHAKLEEVQKIIASEEFKEHQSLFTSETLAHGNYDNIKEILSSEEFKKHRKLFTSTTVSHAKLEDIQRIIQSKEYQEHPELFTSTTIAYAKLEEIQELLKMDCWNDERYKKLLTSSIVSNSGVMIKKIPILLELAEENGISDYITTNFLLKSPSQNYAIIKFLQENNIPLVIDDKLNSIFNYGPGVIKKRYNIDLKELMKKYPFKTKGKSI